MVSFRDQSADNFALRIACRLMVVAPRLERDRGKNDPKKFGDRHVGLRPPGDDMISRRFDQRFLKDDDGAGRRIFDLHRFLFSCVWADHTQMSIQMQE